MVTVLTGGGKSLSHWLLTVISKYFLLHHILIQLPTYIVKPASIKRNEITGKSVAVLTLVVTVIVIG
jgi:hypothetical protein